MREEIVNIGTRVKKRRTENGLRQNDLAGRLGITQAYMSNIEAGKVNCSMPVFVRLCEALNVTPDYLLLGNMQGSNLEKSLEENLRLCSEDDLELVKKIVDLMIDSNADNRQH